MKYLPQMADESARRYLFVAIDKGDEVGLHSRLQGQDRGQRPALPAGSEARLPDAHPHHTNGQWQGVHRSALRPAQARRDGRTRVRHALQPAASSASSTVLPRRSHPRPTAWSNGSTAASRRCCKATTSDRRRAGDHAAPLCLALQPAAPAISPGQQDALAGDEGLAQTQTGIVQETAIPPAGM